ncbi:MAG TPA: phospho-sugar mutase [Clostridia bacterium]|nr:phospho-sugar mutase [Clostridia bacterium]
MNTVEDLYELWLEKTKNDPQLNEELKAVAGDTQEIADRFYRKLEFGTAGLRGVLGAGTNRVNIYTVNQVTQGLADFLNQEYAHATVAIAYDSRINSTLFARESARVLAANGVTTYIFPALMPTPMLSFAVRRLECQSGIIITASHNPSKYNGYKCYDPQGYQMTDAAAQKTYEFIKKTDIFDGVKKMDFDQGLAQGKIIFIEPWLNEEYYQEVMAQSVNPEVCRACEFKLIYTPLNGAGNIPVREIFSRMGLQHVAVVPEQENPDGHFPTCPFPNPEIRQVFEYALKMAEKDPADLLLATDPDCDRVGIAVLNKGAYKLLTGNEVGVLLAEYILSSKTANGSLPKNPLMIKSFVTTDLVTVLAKKYDCEVVDVLTGFKYIGEYITDLEKKGEDKRFILGMEESYGYLAGTHARDKDAVVASMLICEMAVYYKAQGKTLVDVMEEIYLEHGQYLNTVLNFAFEGESGMIKMQQIMDALRQEVPLEIAGMPVLQTSDYESGETTDIATGLKTLIDLPKSNVLAYKLSDNNGVIVRPSGTEPKIKVYITACAKEKSAAEQLAEKIGHDMKSILKIDN